MTFMTATRTRSASTLRGRTSASVSMASPATATNVTVRTRVRRHPTYCDEIKDRIYFIPDFADVHMQITKDKQKIILDVGLFWALI